MTDISALQDHYRAVERMLHILTAADIKTMREIEGQSELNIFVALNNYKTNAFENKNNYEAYWYFQGFNKLMPRLREVLSKVLDTNALDKLSLSRLNRIVASIDITKAYSAPYLSIAKKDIEKEKELREYLKAMILVKKYIWRDDE